ncbi:hypothetical protein WHI96_07920 [Pseudonocardia tropica]|uniref:Uncharacterized protein n=1 Tax=Pseudonocardia tropica TaxID=681289 RepID=A0ABV1JS34_9PSEU
MNRFGLYSPALREFFTYAGRVIVHDDRAELEFLCPGTPVREVPPSIPASQTLPVRLHPDFASVTWPLTRNQFRHAG